MIMPPLHRCPGCTMFLIQAEALLNHVREAHPERLVEAKRQISLHLVK